MIVFAFTLLILLTSIACIQAQTVSGSVADRQTKQPLAYCSVALFKSPDSTLVTGLLTSENGAFKFENVIPGPYYIQTQYIGYSKATIPDRPGIHLVSIGWRAEFYPLQLHREGLSIIYASFERCIFGRFLYRVSFPVEACRYRLQ